jgi:uncharacterized protein YraI
MALSASTPPRFEVARGFARRTISLIAGVAMFAGAALASNAAQAQSNAAVAVPSANLNQRAGPGTQYPPLQVIPRGASVTLYGCISGLSWCEGSYRGIRGWLSANYLSIWHQGRYWTPAQYAGSVRFPILTFNIAIYWDRYYSDRPFYADRDRWISGRGQSGSVQVGFFYDRLAPHGRWVNIDGKYVWCPTVGRDWRPYTDGRWVYTSRGWTWISNEHFGWATYHYGRWGYSHRVGWFWVPGTRWAPAWVSWRRSGDHIAWAPLPPDPNDSFSFGVSHGPIPDYYWQPVQANLFLSINLTVNIIRDEDEKEAVIASTEEVGTVTEQDDVVVNEAIEPEFVEEVTQEEVTPVEVALTTDPEQAGEVEGDTIQIYQPPVEESVSTEPPEVTPIEVVEADSQTAGQAPADEPDTEDQVPPPPPADEPPPPSDAPPMADAEVAVEADAAATAETTTEPVDAGEIVCPEGTTLENGECVLAEAPPPPPPVEEMPAEGAVPPAATEEPPPPPPADEPPAAMEEPPAATEQPPAAMEEPPAPPAATEEPPPPAVTEEPPPPPPPERSRLPLRPQRNLLRRLRRKSHRRHRRLLRSHRHRLRSLRHRPR